MYDLNDSNSSASHPSSPTYFPANVPEEDGGLIRQSSEAELWKASDLHYPVNDNILPLGNNSTTKMSNHNHELLSLKILPEFENYGSYQPPSSFSKKTATMDNVSNSDSSVSNADSSVYSGADAANQARESKELVRPLNKAEEDELREALRALFPVNDNDSSLCKNGTTKISNRKLGPNSTTISPKIRPEFGNYSGDDVATQFQHLPKIEREVGSTLYDAEKDKFESPGTSANMKHSASLMTHTHKLRKYLFLTLLFLGVWRLFSMTILPLL